MGTVSRVQGGQLMKLCRFLSFSGLGAENAGSVVSSAWCSIRAGRRLPVAGLILAVCVGGFDANASTTLRVGVQAPLEPLDLALSERTPTAVMLSSVYERLVQPVVGADDRVQYAPGLARSWTVSADGLSWTFEIEPGHRFSSGEEVTAADVEYSIKRTIGIGRGPASNFPRSLAVRVASRYEVEMTLLKPDALLLPVLSSSVGSIVARSVEQHASGGDHGSSWLATNTAGSGPYMLRRRQAGQAYVLDRNPYYHRQGEGPETLIFEVVPDAAARAGKLQHGDLDMALWLPIDLAKRATRQPGVRIVEGPAPYFTFIALNTQRGPMSDVRLRRALSQAIDRQAIVRYLLGGHAVPYEGPGAGASRVSVGARKSANSVVAAELARRPREPIRIIYIDEIAEAELIAVVLQANLSSMHLPSKLIRLALPGFIDRAESGEYDVAIIKWLARSDDPLDTAGYWLDSDRAGRAGNYARYNNAKVNSMLVAARAEIDTERRRTILDQAIKLAADDVPYIYLARNNHWVTMRSCARGFTWNSAIWYQIPFDRLDVAGCST